MRVEGLGFKDLGLRVSGLRFRAEGFRGFGSGFEGLGFRVPASGFSGLAVWSILKARHTGILIPCKAGDDPKCKRVLGDI